MSLSPTNAKRALRTSVNGVSTVADTPSPAIASASPETPARTRNAFQIKGRRGHHAEYRYGDGTIQRRTFDHEEAANDWLTKQEAIEKAATGPLLGGPERVTLGQFLGEYAFRISIAKESYKSEIDRINHYVEAIGAGRLVARVSDSGKRELMQELKPAELPKAFKAHLDARMAAREKTYAVIKRLARTRVSEVTTVGIRELMTTGKSEGWSGSTIQKEVALLKAAFNTAIKEWKWTGFVNPCAGLKLEKSKSRFVVVTGEQMQRLVKALSECDNRQFWLFVDMAMHTTLRLACRWQPYQVTTAIALHQATPKNTSTRKFLCPKRPEKNVS